MEWLLRREYVYGGNMRIDPEWHRVEQQWCGSQGLETEALWFRHMAEPSKTQMILKLCGRLRERQIGAYCLPSVYHQWRRPSYLSPSSTGGWWRTSSTSMFCILLCLRSLCRRRMLKRQEDHHDLKIRTKVTI